MTGSTLLLGADVVVVVAAALWFALRVTTAAGLVAGASAAMAVALHNTFDVVAATAWAASVVGCLFVRTTRHLAADGGSPSLWPGRFSAAWLILSFPVAVTWVSLLLARWMLHRG